MATNMTDTGIDRRLDRLRGELADTATYLQTRSHTGVLCACHNGMLCAGHAAVYNRIVEAVEAVDEARCGIKAVGKAKYNKSQPAVCSFCDVRLVDAVCPVCDFEFAPEEWAR